MKIKFNSDDSDKSDKTTKASIVIRSFFEENRKYYPHIFLDEYQYEL